MSTTLESSSSVSVAPVVAQAVEFTNAFRESISADPALREAACLRTQYPALMGQIRPGDLLAGRQATARLVYVGSIWWAAPPRRADGSFVATKQSGYCFDFEMAARIGKTDAEREVLRELSEFWAEHCTWTKVDRTYDEEMRRYASGGGQASGGANGFCVTVNSDRLLQRGLPGLLGDVAAKLGKARDNRLFYVGLPTALDVVMEVALHYRDEALSMAESADDLADRKRLNGIAETLHAIVHRAPQTFREAVQLFWLYTHLVSGNHPEAPRLDQSLGDFYARDIDSGVLTEEEALEILLSLWRMFSENGADALCRITIGGKGRRNPSNADRFAMAAMEATRRHRRVTPQLTLRLHREQDPRLLSKAFDCISEGCCFPMLYNDEVVIEGAARAMHLSMEEAESYYPLGCGEYMVGWSSPSVLCCGWSVGKTLDAALHNGYSCGEMVGPATGEVESFDTFDKLYEAFRAQEAFCAEITARVYEKVIDGNRKECPYLLASLLTDDCLETGKGLLEASRHIGACVMGHGFTNAADSLAAIRKVVFEEKRLTLRELVDVLDANFEGHEDVRQMLLAAPKFGNDIDSVDQLLVELWRDMNVAADEARARHGLGFYTVSSVNPGGYGLGSECPATADGRRSGDSFAIGHAPTAGKDTNGLTALFNSVVKVDAANGGATTNFKISREMFTRSRAKLEALFDTYFESGGQEATVTVVSRTDLQAALEQPDQYAHILVRLGGWCARFIDLSRDVQEEIIRRTLY